MIINEAAAADARQCRSVRSPGSASHIAHSAYTAGQYDCYAIAAASVIIIN